MLGGKERHQSTRTVSRTQSTTMLATRDGGRQMSFL